MNIWMLLAMSLLNSGASWSYFLDKKFGLAVVFGAYAVACVGFIMDSMPA